MRSDKSMNLVCKQCGGPAEYMQGGVSRKTGKEYGPRVQCENPDCGAVECQKVPRANAGMQSPANRNSVPYRASQDTMQSEVLNRLALRLENIDLQLKSLVESYSALSTFFRTQQNEDKPLVETPNQPAGETG